MEASLRRIVRGVQSSNDAASDTHVFPGHMHPTTMRAELRLNPFLHAFRKEANADIKASR